MKKIAIIAPKPNWGPNYSIPPGGYFHFGVNIPIGDDTNSNLQHTSPVPAPATTPAASNRFAAVRDENIDEMSKKKRSSSTKQSTAFAIKVLKTFCAETGERYPETEETNNEDLNSLLCKFYIAARRENGQRYKLNSLKSLRFALQRHFLEVRNVDIIDDVNFNRSNTIFENVLKETKAEGLGDTDHHPEVEPEDLEKLYSSIDINNPTGLQELVWFNIMYQMCRRGRQNVREMKKKQLCCSR